MRLNKKDITRANSMVPFRGVLPNVADCKNDAKCIIEKAQLDWQGVKVPLMMQGKHELRPYGQFAMVHGKTGNPIDNGRPVSMAFRMPENKKIISDMCEFSSANGLVMNHAGMLGNGRLVVGHASSPNFLDITGKDHGYAVHHGDLSKRGNQDLVEAGIIMVASYESGKKSKSFPYANRFVCTNGVIFVAAELANIASYSFGHQSTSKYDKSKAEGVFTQFHTQFESYCTRMKDLANIPMPRPVQMAMVMETVQGNLFELVMQETIDKGHMMPLLPYATPSSARGMFLDSLISQDAVEALLLSHYHDEGSRTLKEIITLADIQPGIDFVRGSAAQPYHAITNWVDHERGWSGRDDSAVEASLFGSGAKMKQDALETVVQYAEWVGQQGRVN